MGWHGLVSRLVPRALGIGLSLAGLVYLIGSFSVVLAPDIAAALDPMYVLPLIAELAIADWLLAKGVEAPVALRAPAVVASGAAE